MCRLLVGGPSPSPGGHCSPLAAYKRFFGKKFTTPNMIYRSTDWRSVRGHQSSSAAAAAVVQGSTRRGPHRPPMLATTHHELKTLPTNGTGEDSKNFVGVDDTDLKGIFIIY
jgi:hypothetical protein